MLHPQLVPHPHPYPQIVASVAARLDEFFARQGLPPVAAHRSAHAIVQKLTLYLGEQLWNLDASHGGALEASSAHWGLPDALAGKLAATVAEKAAERDAAAAASNRRRGPPPRGVATRRSQRAATTSR